MKLTIPTAQSHLRFVNLHILGMCLTLITACSVFKEKSFFQTDSLQKQNTREEIKIKESTQTNTVRILNHQDSSDQQSYTEIFPEGLFTYSVKEGFSGNAKRVTINDRLKAGRKVSDSARFRGSNKRVSNITETERQLIQTRQKVKAKNNKNYTSWYLAGIFLIFAAVFAFRWKLND